MSLTEDTWRRLSRFSLGVGIAIALVQLLFTRERGPMGVPGLFYLAYGVMALAMVAFVVSKGMVWARPAWALLSAVVGLHLVGIVYRAIAQGGYRSADLPTVGVADAFYTVAYLLGFLSLVMMIRRVRRRPELLWRIDGLLVFVLVWALGATFIVAALWEHGAGGLPVVVQTFYLTINAAIVALSARLLLATRPVENTGVRMLILAALVFTLTDVITTSTIINKLQTGVMDGIAAAANVMAMALLAAAAAHPTSSRPPSRTPHEGRLSPIRTALASVAVVAAAAAVLAYWPRGLPRVEWVLPVLLVVCLAGLLAWRNVALVAAYRQAVLREETARKTGDAIEAASTRAEVDQALADAFATLLPRDQVSWRWGPADSPGSELAELPGDNGYRYSLTCTGERDGADTLSLELVTPLLVDPLDWAAVESLTVWAVDAASRRRIRAENTRVTETERLARLVADSQDTVVTLDSEWRIQWAVGAVRELTGMAPEHWIGREFTRLVAGVDLDDAKRRLSGGRVKLQGDVATTGARVEVTLGVTDAGEVTAALHDVSTLIAMARQLEYRATHDMLTGLPSRAMLVDMLEFAQESWNGPAPVPTAVVFFDLDDFKAVNDSLGHAFGDGLLVAVGERLASMVRDEGTLARLGGDEFAVVLPGGTAADGIALAQAVGANLVSPVAVDGVEVIVRLSAGVAEAPTDADTAELLMQAADLALYQARQRGRGGVGVYRPEQREQALARLRAANAVTAAARNRAFHFEYQPVVHLPDCRPVAMEALMRWDTGEDLARPDAFIPIAESIGELTNILRDLLPVALRDIVMMRRTAPDLALTVNIHAGALLDEDLDTWLMSELERAGMPPGALILEMSERALIPAQAARTLAALRAHGLQAWIDDFGTGWSNLSSLERLPVNGVKLAREIVVDTTGGLKSDLVAAASALASAVGFAVVAEGVEMREQMVELHQLGVNAVQGFAVARAMSFGDAQAWLAAAE